MPNGNGRYALWLATISGINYEKFIALTDYFGDAEALFRERSEANPPVPGISEALWARIEEKRSEQYITDTIVSIKKAGARCIFYDAPEYPEQLKEIPDPPLMLYIRGKLPAEDICASIVGTRRCTAYGTRVTKDIARILAEHGVTVVSGLALGVDACAHRAALEAGGRTIGIMP